MTLGLDIFLGVVYKCQRCGRFHDDQDEARICCATETRAVWICPVCLKKYFSPNDALYCLQLCLEKKRAAETALCPVCGEELSVADNDNAFFCTTASCERFMLTTPPEVRKLWQKIAS